MIVERIEKDLALVEGEPPVDDVTAGDALGGGFRSRCI